MATALELVVAAAFLGLLAGAVWWDVRLYRIPNVLNAAFAGLFVFAVAVGQVPLEALGRHLGAGGIALLLGMGLYLRGWIGGGDAKLSAVLLLWTGWSVDSLRLVLVMALAGGLVSAVVWATDRRRRTREKTASPDGSETSPARSRVPYGVALAVAGFDFWIRRIFPLFFS